MTDRYGCVLFKHEHCHRLADNVASADYYAVLTVKADVFVLEHFHNACRCARKKAVIADHYMTDIFGMKSVNIFLRLNKVEHLFFIELLWQRKLTQYSVHTVIIVELFNE